MTSSSLRWSAVVLVLVGVRAPGAGAGGRASARSRFPLTNTPSLPARIDVRQDDLVRVTFSTDDIPHSFTIDKYRIAKRVEPGKPIVFEFRADQPGRFPIYCNLTADDGCKKMIGELVVDR